MAQYTDAQLTATFYANQKFLVANNISMDALNKKFKGDNGHWYQFLGINPTYRKYSFVAKQINGSAYLKMSIDGFKKYIK